MSLQGLEGRGDRVPGAWGGMWGRRWVESLEMRDGKYLYQNKFTLKFTFSLQICLILVSLLILFYIFNFLFYLGLQHYDSALCFRLDTAHCTNATFSSDR